MKGKTGIFLAIVAACVAAIWFLWGRTVAVESVYPVENGRHLLSRFVTSPIKGLFDSAGTSRENERLRIENEELKMRLSDARRLALENSRLRKMLGLDGTSATFSTNQWLCAPILAREGANGVRGMLRVKGGWLDGITTNAVAAVPDGLVGRVVETYPHVSVVHMITHPSMRVSCEIASGGVPMRGILYASPLRIRHLPPTATLPARAKVTTSGLGGIFPRGIVVGTVSGGVEPDENRLENMCDVALAVDFAGLEEVFLSRGK